MRMSHSRASSSRWTSVNEELEHIVALMPKLTIEEQGQWKELAYKMQHVAAPPEGFFQTVSAKDQIFGEVGKAYAAKWKDDGKYHNVMCNQDVDQLAIVAGWTALHDFYQLTGDHLISLHHYCKSTFFLTICKTHRYVTFKVYLTEQKVCCSSLDVPSSMYDFLKDKGWTHLHLGDVAKCRLVFNHWRKSLKIGAE
ncbi:hypothetical protein HKD37_03G006308 [Glycine soja]